MMYGENWVFVENPKTGSTSLHNALLAVGGISEGSKHDNLARQNQGYPWRRWRFWTIRNPWDRLVSGYHHNTRSAKKAEREYPNFERWVLDDQWMITPGIDFKRVPQQFWGHRCNIMLRFEYLEEDVYNLGKRLGLELTLPHDNRSKYRQPNYRDYYNSRLKEIVEDRFKPDILRGEYEF